MDDPFLAALEEGGYQVGNTSGKNARSFIIEYEENLKSESIYNIILINLNTIVFDYGRLCDTFNWMVMSTNERGKENIPLSLIIPASLTMFKNYD